MHFPVKSIIKKIIITLSVIAIITFSANAAILYFNNQFQKQLNTKLSNDFLNYIESGDLDDSLKIWPQVYTTKMDDSDFLEDFSNSLHNTYSEYYNQTYKDNAKNDDLHEICRIFFDFISDENFNSVVLSIYDDYYIEDIEYSEFVSAENDFYAISRLKSSYIPKLLSEASVINNSRNTYFQAIETATIEDYSNAIELMRRVTPKDTIYYPKAIEKIDEYILKLKELVKNGS